MVCGYLTWVFDMLWLTAEGQTVNDKCTPVVPNARGSGNKVSDGVQAAVPFRESALSTEIKDHISIQPVVHVRVDARNVVPESHRMTSLRDKCVNRAVGFAGYLAESPRR